MSVFAVRRALFCCSRHGFPRTGLLCTRPAGVNLYRHGFASAAGSKVSKALASEITHEKEQYEQSKEIKKFLRDNDYKFEDNTGDVNMSLVREVGDNVVRIEWQLTSPFDPNMDMEGGEGGDNQEMDSTDFSITIETKSGGSGITVYCSTQSGEDHRFVIGNVKSFNSEELKESVSSYVGPDFEDLDDKLQESLDEYLAEAGMNDEVCNFIDAMALDKEQREYVSWLENVKKFMD